MISVEVAVSLVFGPQTGYLPQRPWSQDRIYNTMKPKWIAHLRSKSKNERKDGIEVDKTTAPSGPSTVKKRAVLASYASSGMISVLVGPDEQVFNVHKGLLFSQSPFCAAQETFSGSDDLQAIRLPDIEIPHFEIIFNWLYTGTLSVTMDSMIEKNTKFSFGKWIQLYHFADILMMTNLQNAMVDADLAHKDKDGNRENWGIGRLSEWYDYRVDHTPYYRLFLSDMVYDINNNGINAKNFKEHVGRLIDYPEAMVTLLSTMADYLRDKWPSVEKGDWCRWHIHEDGKNCETKDKSRTW